MTSCMDKGGWFGPSQPEGQHKGSGILVDGGLPGSVARAGLCVSSVARPLQLETFAWAC